MPSHRPFGAKTSKPGTGAPLGIGGGGEGWTGAFAGAALGATVGSAGALAVVDEHVPFSPALGASVLGAAGGLAAAWMVEEADSRLLSEAIVVVFNVSHGLLTAGFASALGH